MSPQAHGVAPPQFAAAAAVAMTASDVTTMTPRSGSGRIDSGMVVELMSFLL
ncbi:MAG TPA: hypothetical protein VEL28_20155 [Candidatus Binatia bacterium]|nr:hypothetical protein [Candidatus Binatia bacterium]